MTSRVRASILALTLVALFALPVVAAAQSPATFGVKAGLNVATLKFDEDDDEETGSLTGAAAGVFLSKMLNDMWGVNVEGLFSQKGAKAKVGDEKFKLTYIDVPVLLTLSPKSSGSARFNVHTGPQLSFNTKAEAQSGDQKVDVKDQIKSTDFGWVLGVGVSGGRFSADARYTLGLSKIAEDGDNVKNRVFSILVGVKLK
jgi:hypothetical protein